MAARKILTLRRRPVPVSDPDDNVVLTSVNLSCATCGTTWPSVLNGDELVEAKCPRCSPEPPAAA